MVPAHREYLEFGPFRLDMHDRSLSRDGEALPLPPKAADLLFVLVSHRDRIITKEDLLALVWAGVAVEEANIAFQIHVIRRALGDDKGVDDDKYVRTVR